MITVSFKTPDVLDYVLENEFGDEEADEEAVEEARKEAREKLSRWIECEECVTIEFDLDKMTAKVLEV